MSKEIEIKPELAYPDAVETLSRDEQGIAELVLWFGPTTEVMTFKLKNRLDWELFRTCWRVIRRYGSVKIVDRQCVLMAHIFAVDSAIWEVSRL